MSRQLVNGVQHLDVVSGFLMDFGFWWALMAAALLQALSA
jgi:hypothetical protein